MPELQKQKPSRAKLISHCDAFTPDQLPSPALS
jgi:hypothetical protein